LGSEKTPRSAPPEMAFDMLVVLEAADMSSL
jgi:hypothetical protein